MTRGAARVGPGVVRYSAEEWFPPSRAVARRSRVELTALGPDGRASPLHAPASMTPRARTALAHLMFVAAVNAPFPLLWEPTQATGALAERRAVVLWTALAVNVASFLWLRLAADRGGWDRRAKLFASADVATSLLVLVLPSHVVLKDFGSGVRVLGIVFAIFLFAKLFLLVSWAIANADGARERHVRLWVGCLSFGLYVAVTPWVLRNTWPDGDEPHYLLAAHSLVADGDFDLSNNYREKHYRGFSTHDITERHVWLNRRGEDVPVHDVGLSILTAPGYFAGRRAGATVEMNLLAALLAVGIYVLGRQVGASPRGALRAWALFAFASPLVVYASQIYPEVAGANCAVWSAVAIMKFRTSGSLAPLAAAGVLLSVMPWFSVRYWVLLGVMAAGFGLFVLFSRGEDRRRRSARILAVGIPIAVSVAAFAIFDLRWYQTPLPNAGYFHFLMSPGRSVFTSDIPRGLLGLLLDRAYGVLPSAPVYVLALAGIARQVKRLTWTTATLLAAATGYLLFGAANRFWYGGWAPPSRYLFAALALVAPLAAPLLEGRRGRAAGWILGAWTAAVAIAYTGAPWIRYNWDEGRSAIGALIVPFGLADVGRIFPSLVRGSTADYLLAGVWIAAIAGVVLVVVGGSRHDEGGGTEVVTAAPRRDGSRLASPSC